MAVTSQNPREVSRALRCGGTQILLPWWTIVDYLRIIHLVTPVGEHSLPRGVYQKQSPEGGGLWQDSIKGVTSPENN